MVSWHSKLPPRQTAGRTAASSIMMIVRTGTHHFPPYSDRCSPAYSSPVPIHEIISFNSHWQLIFHMLIKNAGITSIRATLFIVVLLLTSPGHTRDSWQSLAPGMDLGTFPASRPSSSGDSRITVLRIDPALWSLEFIGLSLDGGSSGRTARQWSKAYHLTAAINAGMYGTCLLYTSPSPRDKF